MFGLSWIEIFIILVVALVVIGPDKLPEVARGLGRLIRQGQKLVNEVRDTIRMEDMETRYRESSHYTPPGTPTTPPRPDDPNRPIELGPALATINPAPAPTTPEVATAAPVGAPPVWNEPTDSPAPVSPAATTPGATAIEGASRHPAALPPDHAQAAPTVASRPANQDQPNHP
ncbi:MAG: twin-arginine translocase TatA/TatE family subunit [Magnetococcales bacterium]|nr:twin-arginine translocase TatA/TatE family subunit [Magnetococcales bacterium]